MRYIRMKRRRGLGMSLLEAVAVLILMSMALVGLMRLMTESTAQLRASATADRLAQVLDATRNYVRTNYTQLVASAGPGEPLVIPVGKSSPTDAVPTGPSGLPSLQGGGFLPESYVDLNPYGQRHAVLIRETSPNVLEVMITSYGGREIQDGDLGWIASKVGGEGGFMMASPPGGATGYVQGSYGGWRSLASYWANSTASPSAGHVMAVLGFDNGTVLSDFLYRYDIGVPEANRMHTAIDMNGNDIDDTARLGVDRIGNDDGLVLVEDDLEVDGVIYADNGVQIRADWLRVFGSNGMYWPDHGGGWYMSDDSWIRSYADKGIHTEGDMRAARLMDADDETTYVDPDGTSRLNVVEATEMYVRNRNSVVPVSAMLPKYVPQAGYLTGNGQTVPKPTCAEGGTPKIILSLHRAAWGACTMSTNSGGYQVCGQVGGGAAMYARHSGNNWRITVATINNQIAPLVIAQTFCHYD